MCGICGIFNYGKGAFAAGDAIRRMCQIIRHRGPDQEGVHLDGALGMGIRRLSIIDVKGGDQPISNEDGTLWIVYNGEIYNFRELREGLLKRGHTFTTKTDTEVILHLYEEKGVDCLKELRGMFAIALWDAAHRSLFLARDRIGIKPLYYSCEGGTLRFASEIKSILSDARFPRRVNLSALSNYLSFRYVPGPETMFDGIYKLLPGHFIVCDKEGPRISRYWDIPLQEGIGDGAAPPDEELRGLLEVTVREHLVSDVPVGALLSGGLDSSIMVALMSLQANGPVRTFSVGFDYGEEYNELPYARIVAQAFNTDHHELKVSHQDISILEDIIWHMDEPMADPAALPTYLISKVAAQHVTVVLTGEGGDEIFAGYKRYWLAWLHEKIKGVPRPLRALIISSLLPMVPLIPRQKRLIRQLGIDDEVSRFSVWASDFAEKEKERLVNKELLVACADHRPEQILEQYLRIGAATKDFLNRLLYVSSKVWLVDDLLIKVDKMSMAHSLEARVPILDHKVVEFAFSFPYTWKLRGRTSKYIMRRAFEDILPPDITGRKKHGFMVPISHWFKDQLNDYLREILLDPVSRSRGYFNYGYIEKMIRMQKNGGWDVSQQLWTLLNLELWHRAFIDRASQDV